MKRTRGIVYLILGLMFISSGLLLIGCDPIPLDIIRNGTYFRDMMDSNMGYGVHFYHKSAPTVSIDYQLVDGITKTAEFRLDGYDAEKKIGYKLVLKDDKEEWEQMRSQGNLNAPDLNDAELIQNAAIRYQFPVLFMCAYQYQDELNQDEIDENAEEFIALYASLINAPEIKQWAEAGLYDGKWVEEELEEACLVYYNIYFSKKDLPTVKLEYGDNEKAIFQLSGYDTKRRIGYKFVTAEDEKNWNQRRSEGDFEAPDLTNSDILKQAAIEYEFPIIFIYMPEYWKMTASTIFKEEMSGSLDMNEVKQWLDEHE